MKKSPDFGTVTFHPESDVGRARILSGLPLTLPMKPEREVKTLIERVRYFAEGWEFRLLKAKKRGAMKQSAFDITTMLISDLRKEFGLPVSEIVDPNPPKKGKGGVELRP